MMVLVIKISALIFTWLILDPHPHLKSAFGMRVPDADPGDQNHADPCGCGSVTLVLALFFNIKPVIY
jgi:hypothetical protein